MLSHSSWILFGSLVGGGVRPPQVLLDPTTKRERETVATIERVLLPLRCLPLHTFHRGTLTAVQSRLDMRITEPSKRILQSADRIFVDGITRRTKSFDKWIFR